MPRRSEHPPLSTRTIQIAVKAGHRVELWDATVPGLHAVITSSGVATFAVRYRTAAGQRRLRLGRFGTLTVDQARKLARAALADVARGADPQADRQRARKGLTVSAAFDRFIGEPGKRGPRKPRTVDLYRQLFRAYVERPLGRMRVDAVERRDVERLKVVVAKEVGPEVANRTLALVSALMEAAERWGERATASNPCRGVDRFHEQGRERFLRAEERAALAAALDEAADLSPGAVQCIRLLALTGCRRSEIETLTWAMVDTAAACLRLPDSKTGRKVVPLAPQAVAFLDAIRPDDVGPEALVCRSTAGTRLRNVGRVWAIVRERAGLAGEPRGDEDRKRDGARARKSRRGTAAGGVRLHDLRHSFASDALNAGAPLALVGALLGHKSPRTTSRYAHIADDALRRAVEAAGNAIETATREGAKVVRLPTATGETTAKPRRRRRKAKATPMTPSVG